jgi:hypothetical protein
VTYALFLEALTSTALSHDEHCECDVCEAAAGDRDALRRCLTAWSRAARLQEARA